MHTQAVDSLTTVDHAAAELIRQCERGCYPLPRHANDLTVIARALAIAPRIPWALALVGEEYALFHVVLDREDLSHAFVWALLKQGIAVAEDGDDVIGLRIVARFLGSRKWRSTAVRALRPIISYVRRLRTSVTRIDASECKVALGLIALVADWQASHAERVWALENSHTSAFPEFWAVTWMRDVPDAVLRQGMPLLQQHVMHPLVVSQTAVLADLPWMRVVASVLESNRTEKVQLPVYALLLLPAEDRLRSARALLDEFVMPDSEARVAFANDPELFAPDIAPILTPEVVLQLLQQDGVCAASREALLDWFATFAAMNREHTGTGAASSLLASETPPRHAPSPLEVGSPSQQAVAA